MKIHQIHATTTTKPVNDKYGVIIFSVVVRHDPLSIGSTTINNNEKMKKIRCLKFNLFICHFVCCYLPWICKITLIRNESILPHLKVTFENDCQKNIRSF